MGLTLTLVTMFATIMAVVVTFFTIAGVDGMERPFLMFMCICVCCVMWTTAGALWFFEIMLILP